MRATSLTRLPPDLFDLATRWHHDPEDPQSDLARIHTTEYEGDWYWTNEDSLDPHTWTGPYLDQDEAITFARAAFTTPHFDRLDIAAAYYTYAVNYHDGQWSPGYAIHSSLKRIQYKPARSLEYQRGLGPNASAILARLIADPDIIRDRTA